MKRRCGRCSSGCHGCFCCSFPPPACVSGRKNAVKALTGATGYIRRLVGQNLGLRKTPELKFVADDSISHGMNIVKIMNDLHTDDAEKEATE